MEALLSEVGLLLESDYFLLHQIGKHFVPGHSFLLERRLIDNDFIQKALILVDLLEDFERHHSPRLGVQLLGVVVFANVKETSDCVGMCRGDDRVSFQRKTLH